MNEEFIMPNTELCNDWQLFNVQKFGFELPMNKAFWIPATELEDIFNTRAAKSINPRALNNEGPLGYQWYEWLAEAGMGIEPKEAGFVFAARHFSWDYPQLKMLIHECRITKSTNDTEHFLDGIDFLVEFYS